MGRKRDPNRDKAFEIYKASGGAVSLIDIASQLGISDGTVRGWKAKDKWETLLNGEMERPEEKGTQVEEDGSEQGGEQDELFISAVKIVTEAKQASVSLLQRRLRVGYSRAARLIEAMEQMKLISTYQGDKPREVYATSETIDVLTKEVTPVPNKIKNAPKVVSERYGNMERSKSIKNAPIVEEQPEPEIPDDEGLTPKQRIFVMEYLRDFNATRSAMSAGYSKKTAYSIGWELLRKPEIKAIIQRHKDEITNELGLGVQRIIAEYMKIAFTDITDLLDFGQKEVPVMTMLGPMYEGEGDDKRPVTKIVNFVDFKESVDIDGTVISEVKQGKDGVSIKLHDKMKALKELEKYLGYMTEGEKLKLEKARLEIAQLKNGDGDSEDDLIEDWVEAVIGDEDDGFTRDEAETSSIQETNS